jgi:hypothetical protein
MLKKISKEDIDTIDVNKKIGLILEHYSWDLDVKTLMSFLPEIDKKIKKMYVVICVFVTYLSKYIGYTNHYKRELICHIINICGTTRSPLKKKIKVKNYHMDTSQINHMIKLLRENINNGLIIGYFKSVNLLTEYKCLKMYLLSDISKYKILME